MAEETVYVEGIAKLDGLFRRLDKDMDRNLRDELRVAASPVRADAENLARSQITRMTLPWSRMRTGVTSKMVYVAPRKRGQKTGPLKRWNFAGIMLHKAMEPALARNHAQVVERLNLFLGKLILEESAK